MSQTYTPSYMAKRFYRIETDEDEILKEYDSYELELRKDFKSFQKEYNCLYIVEISTNRDGDIIEIETIEFWEKPKRKKKRNVKLVIIEEDEKSKFLYPERCQKFWNVQLQKDEWKQYLGAGHFCEPELK